MQARRVLSDRFASLPDFLDRTAEEDREFLPEGALDRFPAVCCGMSNGVGGWIVLGAEWDEDAPVVHGVSDPSGLERRLRTVLAGERMLSADTVGTFIPIFLHSRGIDPAVATGPFITTSNDILGILIYFMIAKIILGF